MFLSVYSGRTEIGPFRGTASQCRRIAAIAKAMAPCNPVLAPEPSYSPSQLAVLNAIADQQETEFLADLTAGLIHG